MIYQITFVRNASVLRRPFGTASGALHEENIEIAAGTVLHSLVKPPQGNLISLHAFLPRKPSVIHWYFFIPRSCVSIVPLTKANDLHQGQQLDGHT
jgi:hypothetical protein